MAGRIRDADIAALRERINIAEVIGAYVQLRPAGAGRMKGLCPFHEEKTPSFSVTTTTGYYHCFGCEASGDAITFVREMESLSFTEAVERLASSVGMTLTYEGGSSAARSDVSKRQRMLEASALAAEFYAEQLRTTDAVTGRRFLSERGFDEAAAMRFGVGYAPDGWDDLAKHLLARKFTVEELEGAGLARRSQRGSLIDRFRRRLLWPIRDISGSVVGFGARKLYDDDNGPKYLNTPETPLFKKSSLLYGVDLARKDIGLQSRAVIVEGYTDVMACHLAGVTTAVATCGTAFGADHVTLLRRLLHDQDEFRGEVIFTFDGDSAGQKAAVRAFAEDQRFTAQTYVAVESEGRDPCELRMAAGDAAVRDLIAQRVPLFEFVLRQRIREFDLETAEGRVGALSSAAPIVAGIKDRALRPEYARRLAGWLGFPDPEPVLRRVAELSGERAPASGRPAPRRTTTDGPTALAEREALKVAVQFPQFAAEDFDKTLTVELFTLPAHQAVREAITAAGGTSGVDASPDWVERLRGQAPDDEIRGLITALAVESLHFFGEDIRRYSEAVLRRVEELDVTRRITQLKGKLQRMNPLEAEGYSALLNELLSLEQRRRQLLEGGGSAA
jgi:DNA primase